MASKKKSGPKKKLNAGLAAYMSKKRAESSGAKSKPAKKTGGRSAAKPTKNSSTNSTDKKPTPRTSGALWL